jgi:hypothetical protein
MKCDTILKIILIPSCIGIFIANGLEFINLDPSQLFVISFILVLACEDIIKYEGL